MTDVITDPSSEAAPNAPPKNQVRFDGVVIGLLLGLDNSGMPLVGFAGNPQAEATPARSTAQLTRDDIGREVALLFEEGDPARPLVIGRIQHPEETLEPLALNPNPSRWTVNA